MMPSVRNLMLIGLVLLLLALEWLLAEPGSAGAPASALLPELERDRVARIRIEGAGERVELARRGTASDGTWVVRERFDFPAYGPAVEGLLLRLANLRDDDLVGRDAGSHTLFGLGEDDSRLSLLDAEGAPLAELRVSSAAVDTAETGVPGVHLRLADGDEVYRCAALGSVQAAPVHWLDTRLATLDVGAVDSLQLDGMGVAPTATGEASTLYLLREPDGRWGVAGSERRLPPVDLQPLLLTLANLYFEDVESTQPANAGLDPARWRVSLGRGDEEPLVIHLGGRGEGLDRARLAAWGTPWVVRLPASSAERLAAAIEQVLTRAR